MAVDAPRCHSALPCSLGDSGHFPLARLVLTKEDSDAATNQAVEGFDAVGQGETVRADAVALLATARP